MKKVNIVGAGPAGLYFALLLRADSPRTEISIWERDAPDISHGWGIVLNNGTLEVLKKYDLETHHRIATAAQSWRNLTIYQHGNKLELNGFPYISIARIALLTVLREVCERRGIDIRYGQTVNDVSMLSDCDLLVGADGANSLVRRTFSNQFQTSIDLRNNRFIWLGTERVFDAFTMMFRKQNGFVFCGEGYRFSDTMSTFIAQCTEDTWKSAGLSTMSVDESTRFVADVFGDELHGCSVVPNASSEWRNFPFIQNRRWAADNVLLLGDALHTAHFSTGSGTRLAFEDAIAATRCLRSTDSIADALHAFEQRRKPHTDRFQATALESLKWYERIEEVIDLEPVPFAFSALTRSNAVDLRIVKMQDPAFARRYVKWRDEQRES